MKKKNKALKFEYNDQTKVLRCLNRDYTVNELLMENIDSAIMMITYFHDKWDWKHIYMTYNTLEGEYHVAQVF